MRHAKIFRSAHSNCLRRANAFCRYSAILRPASRSLRKSNCRKNSRNGFDVARHATIPAAKSFPTSRSRARKAKCRRRPPSRPRRKKFPAPTNCSSPACTWNNIATPRVVRRFTGAKHCGAIRWIRAATMRMGLWHLRRGEFVDAEKYFRKAIERLTRRNANPYDGEALLQSRSLPALFEIVIDDAYDVILQSHMEPGVVRRQFSCAGRTGLRRTDWDTALEHLNRSLRFDTDNLRARNLKAIVLRKLNRPRRSRRISARNARARSAGLVGATFARRRT